MTKASSKATLQMLLTGVKTAQYLAKSSLHSSPVRSANQLPQSVDQITCEWLTEVLCAGNDGAKVIDFGRGDGSRGTHERRRLLIMYNQAGREAGLPTSIFTKSLPSLTTRMLVGFMGHSRYEMLFYQQLRPNLRIETPVCYFSGSDKRTLAALHVLEDVSYSKEAVFLDERTRVTYEMAVGMVELLAELHSAFYRDPRLDSEFGWLIPFPTWVEKGVERVHTDVFSGRAVEKAKEVLPSSLYRRRSEIWPATMEALSVHRTQPSTVIHSDVHIGNWYQTRAGAMGLLDWQVLTRGHWSRDLAYALSTALTTSDRREWESELVSRYLEVFQNLTGETVDFDAAFLWYRQQMLHAFHMWTQTLCHPTLQPNSQRDEMTFELLARIGAAIDDLDSTRCRRPGYAPLMPPSRFDGRTAIVTGGSRGIGRAIAAALVNEGAQVVIVSRKAQDCQRTAADIGRGCDWISANVGDPDAAQMVVAEVVQRYGEVNLLVNNAATNPYLGLTIGIDVARWEKILRVNLTAPLLWTQEAWRATMQTSRTPAAVLNVASVGGYWTSRDHGAYDVSKAALLHLTKQLAAELGPRVRVNALAPGLTRTDFNQSMFEVEGSEDQIAAEYPMRRIGTLGDMAAAALFLLSDEASWITGQALLVDGGGIYGFARTG